MKSVAELRRLLYTTPTDSYVWVKVENFLLMMDQHNLEASHLAVVCPSSVALSWYDGFNQSHTVLVYFTGDLIMAVSMADGKVDRTWHIDGPQQYHALKLSVEETMEYIRHYIWANHT